MTAWFNMSRTYGPGHRIHIVAKLDSGSSRPTIGVEQTGRAALAEMREDGEGVELILMDIRMPELDGFRATRRIIAADETARILILTTFGLDEYVYEALCAAANGFVLKDDPPEQLIAAVHTVAAGDALLSPAITKRVIRQFTRIPRPVPPRELDELTARERDILLLIARGLSNSEIGQQLYISETTVKTHVTHTSRTSASATRVPGRRARIPGRAPRETR